MKKNLLLILIIVFSTTLFSQGKLFNADEAQKLFGNVVSQRAIETKQLAKIVKEVKTQKILFGLKKRDNAFGTKSDRDLIIANSKRNVHHWETPNKEVLKRSKLENSDMLYKFDCSIVLQLLEESGTVIEDVTYIQLRDGEVVGGEPDILSIQNGETVLELSIPCPPLCGD